MPIVKTPSTSGSQACEPMGDCFSDPGALVEACPKCGETCSGDSGPCSCVVNEAPTECSPCSTVSDTTAEQVQGKDACCAKGTASTAASTACHEAFRGTTRVQKGFPLVKSAPGDKCLKHLAADEEAFQVSDPDCGARLTKSPNVDIPIAQGYKRTVTGNLLIDVDGKPVLGDTPEFTDIWISGLKSCPNRLFRLRAPKVDKPITLVAENGNYRFRSDGEKKLCSDILPDTATEGRLLLLDRVADCEGEEWCPKEFKLDLEEGTCVLLVATQDEDGFTQLGTVTPSSVAGFLRSNPEAPCSPLNGADLSEGEATQLTGFLDQLACDPELPDIEAEGHTTVIDRLMACGTRTFGPEVTIGSQPFSLQELYNALRGLDPEVGEGTPVSPAGDPLVDGQAYDAVWDATLEKLVYKPAHRTQILAPTLAATPYMAVNQNSSNSQAYPVNLATSGINAPFATHVELLFELDARYRSRSSTSEAYVYVEIQGQRLFSVGQVNRGQTSFSSGDEGQGNTGAIRLMVPIVSGAISFTIGHHFQNPSGDIENEFYGAARFIAVHENPVIL